jgi:hypothetical protein
VKIVSYDTNLSIYVNRPDFVTFTGKQSERHHPCAKAQEGSRFAAGNGLGNYGLNSWVKFLANFSLNVLNVYILLAIGADFQDVYLLKHKLTQSSHIAQCRRVPCRPGVL